MLEPASRIRIVRAMQALPEHAAELAAADTVYIVDADVRCDQPQVEPLSADVTRRAARAPMSHSISANEAIALARQLYGFGGRAYSCHVPAVSFGSAEGLSPQTEKAAASMATMLRELLMRGPVGE